MTDLIGKVAIVHEWIEQFAGSERVLEGLLDIFPDAQVFTLVYSPNGILEGTNIRKANIKASWLQKFSWTRKHFRTLLPILPYIIEQFDVSEYPVVISSNHAVAKGVITGPDQLHICYCHTPVRYAWDQYWQYMSKSSGNNGVLGHLRKIILHYLRMWDVVSANRVDYFVANSHFVARRVYKTYRRKAKVIYPPVDVDRFSLKENKDSYFVTVSRLVHYKNIDIVVEAFNKLNLPLLVIGDGPLLKAVKKIARPNIKVMGWLDGESLRKYIENARALVFAAKEDFGITPVEAQAAGTPVIALGSGGVVESVIPINPIKCYKPSYNAKPPTGVFFYQADPSAVEEAVKYFIKKENQFDPVKLRENAERFKKERFLREMKKFIEEKYREFQESIGL